MTAWSIERSFSIHQPRRSVRSFFCATACERVARWRGKGWGGTLQGRVTLRSTYIQETRNMAQRDIKDIMKDLTAEQDKVVAIQQEMIDMLQADLDAANKRIAELESK